MVNSPIKHFNDFKLLLQELKPKDKFIGAKIGQFQWHPDDKFEVKLSKL